MVGGDSLQELKQSIMSEQDCLIPDIVGKGDKESINGDAIGQIVDLGTSINMENRPESVGLESNQITTTSTDQVDMSAGNSLPVTQSVLEIVRYSYFLHKK